MNTIILLIIASVVHKLGHLFAWSMATGKFPYADLKKKLDFEHLTIKQYLLVCFEGFVFGLIVILFASNWLAAFIYMLVFSKDIHRIYHSYKLYQSFPNDTVVKDIKIIKTGGKKKKKK